MSLVPEDLKAELDAAEAELQEVYRRLWPLREAYAQAVPPAALPSRRNRTEKQALIARCPRCGGQLASEDQETYWAEMQRLRKEREDATNDS